MSSEVNATHITGDPDFVRIVEVGPRDGLQNESKLLSVEQKVHLIKGLIDAGVSYIEAGSFVSPKWAPQMASSAEVIQQLPERKDVVYAALTPNLKGMEAALQTQVNEVAVFTAASEAFNQRNINCSIQESIERFQPVFALAQERNIPVRGYVSCVLGCPYEGRIEISQVLKTTKLLLEAGCYEVSLGDTIGVGSTHQVANLLKALLSEIQSDRLAVHFHDTYGQALANIDTALNLGIRTVDASVAGLGGCPYAKGASGNVATEDVVYMLHGNGLKTNIDLNRLAMVGNEISALLARNNGSKAGLALSQAQSSQ
ncbi:Isopropylmalate/homocitrate/citramalate synthases [Hahella chejuensis KCTC 2396]|uniref:hydroxymethylglutaryl-CoA lyase n=1 Tax=Hahella chejuensis (strain KCTC 2396) TaxID=349521 RepID=Q2SFA7_HAHCH|nr:hydroxymethylglutaryl-CoA lyase [Hahella chejuensis]ABC30667.1 Isopropylmalate/homocitrate/citramalate synthases [Hahella chejuensis KCTC 2396]